MSADRFEDQSRDKAREMEQEAGELEERLDRLDSGLEDAHDAAAEHRKRLDDEEAVPSAAGEWRGEATGAQQGDDTEETEREDPDTARDQDEREDDGDEAEGRADDDDEDGDARSQARSGEDRADDDSAGSDLEDDRPD